MNTTEQSSKKIKVLLLQRAVPHYRLPLFRQLSLQDAFNLKICSAAHDFKTSTGLPAKNYDGLDIKLVKIWKLGQTLLFQQIIALRSYDVIIMDISINLLSNPIYFLLAKLHGVKVIGWGKGIPQDNSSKENTIKKAYKKFVVSQCDTLILYGEISRQYFDELGYKNKPKFVAQNTIDTQWLIDNHTELAQASKQYRSELGLNGKFIFGYFGKLTSRKGVDNIIEAFKKIKSANDGAVLIIAGSGPHEATLRGLTDNWEYKEAVIFLGKITPGEEGKIINLFDAYLSFSQGGLGILEAMATARLIISTPEIFPETELLINNVNCLLSKEFTVESFSEAMEKALTLGDKKLELGESALKTVREKATILNMVESFKKAINKSLNSN